MRELHAGFSKNRLDEIACLIVQMRISGIRHDAVQVICDRADIFRDRPFVVIEDDDEPFGVRLDVIERFVTDSTGKRCIARDYDDVFVTAAQVASDGHSERCGERRPSVTCSVAIVFALGAQKKAVEPARIGASCGNGPAGR